MKPVEAFEVVLLDLSDIIVLEVQYHSVFRNLLRNRDLTCWQKHKCLIKDQSWTKSDENQSSCNTRVLHIEYS